MGPMRPSRTESSTTTRWKDTVGTTPISPETNYHCTKTLSVLKLRDGVHPVSLAQDPVSITRSFARAGSECASARYSHTLFRLQVLCVFCKYMRACEHPEDRSFAEVCPDCVFLVVCSNRPYICFRYSFWVPLCFTVSYTNTNIHNLLIVSNWVRLRF